MVKTRVPDEASKDEMKIAVLFSTAQLRINTKVFSGSEYSGVKFIYSLKGTLYPKTQIPNFSISGN